MLNVTYTGLRDFRLLLNPNSLPERRLPTSLSAMSYDCLLQIAIYWVISWDPPPSLGPSKHTELWCEIIGLSWRMPGFRRRPSWNSVSCERNVFPHIGYQDWSVWSTEMAPKTCSMGTHFPKMTLYQDPPSFTKLKKRVTVPAAQASVFIFFTMVEEEPPSGVFVETHIHRIRTILVTLFFPSPGLWSELRHAHLLTSKYPHAAPFSFNRVQSIFLVSYQLVNFATHPKLWHDILVGQSNFIC